MYCIRVIYVCVVSQGYVCVLRVFFLQFMYLVLFFSCFYVIHSSFLAEVSAIMVCRFDCSALVRNSIKNSLLTFDVFYPLYNYLSAVDLHYY